MPKRIQRNKRQILFQHLPGQIYDYGREKIIARTTEIRGSRNTEINNRLLLSAIENKISGWPNNQRLLFSIPLVNRINDFVLIEPRSVSSELFPLVFWCQNRECGRVFSYSNSSDIPRTGTCPTCNRGRLIQLRFVKIHRCGELLPLEPYYCGNCQSSNFISLDTRGSEKLAGFQWRCSNCGQSYSVFARRCRSCSWDDPIQNVNNPQQMNIQVHRAGKNFYPHFVTLLNQPSNELNNLLSQEDWAFIIAGSYLDIIPNNQTLLDIGRNRYRQQSNQPAEIDSTQINRLRERGHSDDQINDFIAMQKDLLGPSDDEIGNNLPDEVIDISGVSREGWENAGYELLETILPRQTGNINTNISDIVQLRINEFGIDEIALLSDFPITTAIFGYSREDYRPGYCYIKPFPPDNDNNNKFPVYVDLIQADAIMIKLDQNRIFRWLALNGFPCQLPMGSGNEDIRLKAFYVDIFNELQLRETIGIENPQARLIFGLLHTMSHSFVRQAALLSGLERTSLSEYVLPRSLTFAIYSSHRFGATIGALTALFEQSLEGLFTQVLDTSRCVYDPVCIQDGGNCHACVHLAEMSCQFFNLNLGRVFLFGGSDPVLNQDIIGYFEMDI